MPLILFNIGLLSLLSQVILLRELAVAFYGVELIYIFALGVWLLFTAAGAMISRHRIATAGTMTAALLCLAILLPLDIVFIRASRHLFAGVPGAYLPFYHQLLVPMVSLFPIGLLTGFIFPLAATIYITVKPDKERTMAGAYGIESLGALAGGIISTLFLIFHLPVSGATLLCSAFIALTSLIIGKMIYNTRLPALALALFCLVALNWTSWLDHKTIAWNHPHLVESQDTAYGRTTITDLSGQVAVFENDVLSFETEGREGETFAQLTALQHSQPRHVLLLGGGTEGILEALRQHPVERIDVVELNPRMVGMVLPHLPPQRGDALKTPPVRLIFTDPRNFLRHSDSYDLILVAMPDPASGQSNRFYTREFFQTCAARLRPGGIMGLRLRSAENIWPPPLMYRMASIYGAIKSVFPHVLFLPGTTNIVTAASTPLADNPATLIERWQSRRISASLVRPPFINYLFTNDRFREIRNILETTVIPANSDIRPVCYGYTLQIWLTKFFPRASFLSPTLPLPAILFSLAITAAAFFLVRTHGSRKRLFLAGVSGFCGMVLQNALLLHYQVKNGALFQDIGLLMACFMAGMAGGAIFLSHRLSLPDRRWGGLLLGGFFALTILIYLVFIGESDAGLLVMACLLACSGFLTGALFAYTTLADPTTRHPPISSLYAADLLGGGAGALLGGLILIPAAGLDIPVQVVGALLLLSFLII